MNLVTTLTPQTPMAEVLLAFPSAQRALFKRYHIGGCSSCAFRPDETLEGLCARNGGLKVDEMIEHILASQAVDEKLMVTPQELARWRTEKPDLRLLDVRTREEFEAVRIGGAVLMSQETMQEVLSRWPREEIFVIYDHSGKQALDAAAYFQGHGFQIVRCLQGGIDAWSMEVDPQLPRYRLG